MSTNLTGSSVSAPEPLNRFISIPLAHRRRSHAEHRRHSWSDVGPLGSKVDVGISLPTPTVRYSGQGRGRSPAGRLVTRARADPGRVLLAARRWLDWLFSRSR
jgi:hypothetical protein